MSTTRAQYAAALVQSLGASPTSDYVRVGIAWQMEEGQTAAENDPLAHWNSRYPKPPGESGDKFAYDTIDHALTDDVASMRTGAVYGSIGDAFRAGKPAAAVIAAIGLAGWCGGPHAPCPAYGAGIAANFARLGDAATLAREGSALIATTTLSGSAGSIAGGTSGTSSTPPSATDTGLHVPNPLNVIPGAGTLGNVDKAFSHLVDPSWWKRVGVFVLGGALAFYGLKMLKPDVADALSNGASSVRAAASSGPGVTTTPAKAGGAGKSIVEKAVEGAATAAAVA